MAGFTDPEITSLLEDEREAERRFVREAATEPARNARISLEAAASEADTRLADLLDLWATFGNRPFAWFTAKTAGEALLRNSYIHPRRHLAEHYVERGDRSRGAQIKDETMAALGRIGAPESVTSVWS